MWFWIEGYNWHLAQIETKSQEEAWYELKVATKDENELRKREFVWASASSTKVEVDPCQTPNGACFMHASTQKNMLGSRYGQKKTLGLSQGRGQPWLNVKSSTPLTPLGYRIILKHLQTWWHAVTNGDDSKQQWHAATNSDNSKWRWRWRWQVHLNVEWQHWMDAATKGK